MVRLKSLTAQDWPLWRDARLAALTEAPHAFTSRPADWPHGGEERWRARLSLPGFRNPVALGPSAAPLGLASGVPGEGGLRELRSVWVAPAAREQGVGAALLAEVERWARDSGGTALRLAVLPGNAPAIALYERCGFVRTDEPGPPLPDGDTCQLVMAKPLPRAGR
ncbi:GNAT family N-acetyltransferase [Streptomyces sp. DSM 44917]|uniref:GNAT family N-acetyltransferase n=1 Tax=Streptomyces boetiae TaxID=3075541 RepID=A0ABU2L3G4_9ACTN|nr:GNAT family N-acetyltransferase [Streptomyces sp. DSM 44917]MDT0306057.1 GNAT family N-acetyltransferase [Streptomyces sp. DSM 44917]